MFLWGGYNRVRITAEFQCVYAQFWQLMNKWLFLIFLMYFCIFANQSSNFIKPCWPINNVVLRYSCAAQNVQSWKLEQHLFPDLKSLKLSHCEQLECLSTSQTVCVRTVSTIFCESFRATWKVGSMDFRKVCYCWVFFLNCHLSMLWIGQMTI